MATRNSTAAAATTENDPVAAARAATEAGVEHLRQLRARHAQELAARDQLVAGHGAQLAAAEEAFAAAEAEQQRLEQLAQVRDRCAAELAGYQPLDTEANELITRVHPELAAFLKLFGDALLAERARDQAARPLRAAYEELRRHDEHAAPPKITELRLHNLPATDPVALIGFAVVLTDDRFADERASVIAHLERRIANPNVIIERRG
jgi:hypothetical protein